MDAPTSSRPSPGALVLSVSLFLVLRAQAYDPSVGIALGGTSIDVSLADLSVVAVVLVALHRLRSGSRLTGDARILWVGGFLCAFVVAATFYGPLVSDGYPLAASIVSAGTFIEYALLALATAVLIRTRDDVYAFIASFTLLAVAAAVWGSLQFLGVVNEFEGKRPLQREVSFLGNHDFAAVGGATLGIAFAILAAGLGGHWRRVGWAAAIAGTISVILAASMTTVAATILCAAIAVAVGLNRHLLDRPRTIAIITLTVVAFVGSVGLRAGDIGAFLKFLGVGSTEAQETNVETGSQRAVLSYIGVRIFLDHPAIGVGWQGNLLESNFSPYLADARKRFPNVSPEALPTPEHQYGIQNAYIQAAADLGVGGFLLAVTLVLGGILTAFGQTKGGSPEVVAFGLMALFWLVVAGAEWAALGLVPGIPTTALLWLGLGGAVAWACAGAVPDISIGPEETTVIRDGATNE